MIFFGLAVDKNIVEIDLIEVIEVVEEDIVHILLVSNRFVY